MRAIPSFTLIALTTLLAGCGGPDPAAVAEDFWSALSSGNRQEAARHATRTSAPSIQNWDLQVQSYQLGGAREQDGTVEIPTTVVIVEEEGKPRSLGANTLLLKEDGEWRVEASATLGSVVSSYAQQAMMEAGRQLQKSMQQMGRQLQQKMQEMQQGQ